MADDKRFSPAGDGDDSIESFLDAQWREAMAGLRQSMEALRKLTPELVVHLPERGADHLNSALSSSERGYEALHRAGPHVIGTDAYEAYLRAQTARALGS